MKYDMDENEAMATLRRHGIGWDKPSDPWIITLNGQKVGTQIQVQTGHKSGRPHVSEFFDEKGRMLALISARTSSCATMAFAELYLGVNFNMEKEAV